MENHVEIAFEALKAKQDPINTLFRYYDGDHPQEFASRRLKQVFGKSDLTQFSMNWCAVVIDSTVERIQLTGFNAAEQAKADTLNQLFKTLELDLDSDEAHRAALVAGEGYIIAWPDDEGRAQAFYNDPRLVHIQYNAENPRLKDWAAKWWREGKRIRMNLYYSDHIEYYETGEIEDNRLPESASAFGAMEVPEAPNPFKSQTVPVFSFRHSRRSTKSELDNVLPLQRAVNMLLANMLVASEFGAFKQRWIISNSDTAALKNSPWQIWSIPAGDGEGQAAQIGQFDETELENFLKAIDNLSGQISTISRTPRHYFFATGDAPSGEALIAMEAPLNKKCSRYIQILSNTWQRLAAFLLELSGEGGVSPEDIEPIFDQPETIQPRTQAEIIQMNVNSKIPLKTALRLQGWSDAMLDQLDEDKKEEAESSAASLATALMNMQRKDSQENEADADDEEE